MMYYINASSEDGFAWTDINSKVKFPVGVRHGSIIKIDESKGKKLIETLGY